MKNKTFVGPSMSGGYLLNTSAPAFIDCCPLPTPTRVKLNKRVRPYHYILFTCSLFLSFPQGGDTRLRH